MFENLKPIPADPLLTIIGQYRSDARDNKIDLGVGVYRNSKGLTPVMNAVKKAERKLVETQSTKTYVGMAGDLEFVHYMGQLSLGSLAQDEARLFGIQTPGGTAALRLASDLIKRSNPDAKIWLGTPSWDNHLPILEAADLRVEQYSYCDDQSQGVNFDSVMTALSRASRGDAVLLQGCCHNPTGRDFSIAQWQSISELCNQTGLIPFIDIAYQGLGSGLKEDIQGVNLILDNIPEAIITVSCSKNFGLYRERTGAIFVLASNRTDTDVAKSNLFSVVRANYSMPPDHGAAIVRTILSDQVLKQVWENELAEMRKCIRSNQIALIGAMDDLRQASFLSSQRGMFSMLPLNTEQIDQLRDEHAIYMARNGRINIAGFKEGDIERFAAVVKPFL